MRKSCILGGILAAGAACAATPIDGWYAAGFGGYTYLPENVSVTVNNQFIDGPSYNNGFNAGGRLGFKNNPLRYELEFTYLQTSVKEFYVNNTREAPAYGQSVAGLGMANIYYDLPENIPCIAPFLGVGIGYAHVESRLESDTPVYSYFKGRDNVFAYQVTTGLSYNFAENYSLDIAYRYVATEHADNLGKGFQAHIASAGLTYRFNENSYK